MVGSRLSLIFNGTVCFILRVYVHTVNNMFSNVDLEFFVVWVVGNWFRGLCNQ
jgi:hypothetical protein